MNNPVAGRFTLCYHIISKKQLAQSKTLCRAYIASVDAENANTQIERRKKDESKHGNKESRGVNL